MGDRYYEVDAVRGSALFLMVLYHILFCLFFFGIIDWFNPYVISGAFGAAVFILVAGLSLVLANRKPSGVLKRGVQLIACGMIITAVTWIVYPQGFVIFGILHLIGFGTILSLPFLSKNVKWFVPAVFGILIVGLSFFLDGHTGSLLLLPFGLPYAGFVSLDYEPLIPWFGVLLLGAAAGKLLYPSGRCRLLSRLPAMPSLLRPVCFVGRHTLIIYMLHVPVIILAVFLIFPDAVLSFLF